MTSSTNREIGGVAPTKYLAKIESKGKVKPADLDTYISTHWVDVDCMRRDDFDQHIIKRAKIILSSIERAMGKTISGKDSQETIDAFGTTLL